MTTKRFLTAVCALGLMMALCGCAHKRCCGDDSRSNAPPPGCCNKSLPPGYIPPPGAVVP
jgi:hypothetical protein